MQNPVIQGDVANLSLLSQHVIFILKGNENSVQKAPVARNVSTQRQQLYRCATMQIKRISILTFPFYHFETIIQFILLICIYPYKYLSVLIQVQTPHILRMIDSCVIESKHLNYAKLIPKPKLTAVLFEIMHSNLLLFKSKCLIYNFLNYKLHFRNVTPA